MPFDFLTAFAPLADAGDVSVTGLNPIPAPQVTATLPPVPTLPPTEPAPQPTSSTSEPAGEPPVGQPSSVWDMPFAEPEQPHPLRMVAPPPDAAVVPTAEPWLAASAVRPPQLADETTTVEKPRSDGATFAPPGGSGSGNGPTPQTPDPELPLVTIDALDSVGAEHLALDTSDFSYRSSTGVFRIERTGDLDAALTVYYEMADVPGPQSPHTATNNVDFAYINPTQAIIPAGARDVTIPTTVIDDADIEGPEFVRLTLQPNSDYELDANNQERVSAQVDVLDDDFANPDPDPGEGFASGGNSFGEWGSNDTIYVKLTSIDPWASEAEISTGSWRVSRRWADMNRTDPLPEATIGLRVTDPTGDATHAVDYERLRFSPTNPLSELVFTFPYGVSTFTFLCKPVQDELWDPGVEPCPLTRLAESAIVSLESLPEDHELEPPVWAFETALVGIVENERLQVVETEWVGYDPGDGKTNYEKGGNPISTGGGDRIFAERNQPQGRNGDQIHDKIYIRATLSAVVPALQVVSVRFILKDPDLYSDDFDFDPKDNPNNPQGGAPNTPNDNIMTGFLDEKMGATLMNSTFTQVLNMANATQGDVVFAGDGVSKTVTVGLLITDRQPCNNYHAISFVTTESLTPSFKPDGKSYFSDAAKTKTLEKSKRTDMLTVWRTLHAEIDTMDTIDYEMLPGASLISWGTVIGPPVPLANGFGISLNNISLAQADQFEHGSVKLYSGTTYLGRYDVLGNSTGQNPALLIATDNAHPVPNSVTHFESLEDDDITEHDITTEDMVPQTQLWASRFAPACVKVDFDKTDLSPTGSASVNGTIPFAINVGAEQATFAGALNNIISANKQSVSTQDFWAVYQIGAFQSNYDEDGDPDGDWMLGYSAGPMNRFEDQGAGTIVFAETMLDCVQEMSGVTSSISTVFRLFGVSCGQPGWRC